MSGDLDLHLDDDGRRPRRTNSPAGSIGAAIDHVQLSRLERQLRGLPRPHHVGLVMDGNRRWARLQGFSDIRIGHRAGAEHLETVLGWCTRARIDRVSAYVLSLDNLTKRGDEEIQYLLRLLETRISEYLTQPRSPWSLHLVGSLDRLPATTAGALRDAAAATRGRPSTLTLAIGYDGRAEITAAVREILLAADRDQNLLDLAATIDEQVIDAHIGASGHEIDLVIRTSGELRSSGFFPWRSSSAELVFVDFYWPAFTHRAFLRALRTYGRRKTARA